MENLAQTDVNNIYMIVGTLIVMNIGGIAGALWLIIKLVWNAAKYDSKVEKMKADIDAAHVKIRQLESRDDI